MQTKDISIILNSLISLAELVIRYKQENPIEFDSESEKVDHLKSKIDELSKKPDNYLYEWTRRNL